MAPYVACHIGLLWLRGRIHNVYTAPWGMENKPRTWGANVLGDPSCPLLCSPPSPCLSFPSHPSWTVVLKTTGPAVCASKQAGVSGRRCQDRSIPVRFIHITGVGTRERSLSPALLTQGFRFHLLCSPRIRNHKERSLTMEETSPLAWWSHWRDPLMGNYISPVPPPPTTGKAAWVGAQPRPLSPTGIPWECWKICICWHTNPCKPWVGFVCFLFICAVSLVFRVHRASCGCAGLGGEWHGIVKMQMM